MPFLSGLLFLAVVIGSGAHAAEPMPAGMEAQARPEEGRDRIEFEIPAQPLVTAVETFSMESGIQVLYDSRLAAGRRSNGVKGVFAPDEALAALLDGTDLTIRYTASNDIVLAPRSETVSAGETRRSVDGPVLSLDTLYVQAAAEPRTDSGYRAYAGIVQADIQNALHEHSDSRSGTYRIGLKLWVNGNGGIRQSEIFKSTGDPRQDAVVSQILQEITISQAPPAGMPQPVSIMIVARSL